VLRKPEAALLVDIALLPISQPWYWRGLVRELIEQCNKSKLAVRLQVLRTNPAQRLYERLGFRKTGKMNCTSRWSGHG